MQTIINSLSVLIKTLADSLQLQALFPALIFTGLNNLFIAPHLIPILEHNYEGDFALFQQPMFTAVIVFLLGYTINAVEVSIVRLFEGYSWERTFLGKARSGCHRKRFRKLRRRLDFYESKLVHEYLHDRNPESIARYKTEIRDSRAQLTSDYPPRVEQILPTKLGNRIAAFESYPVTKYQIESVTFWPRIVPILAKEGYLPYIIHARSTLDFSLNMSLLLALFGFECLLLRLFVVELSAIIPVISFIFCWIFYAISTEIVFDWAVSYETAFDLFRYHLARSLGIKVASSFEEERRRWKRISDFWNDKDPPENLNELNYTSTEWPV